MNAETSTLIEETFTRGNLCDRFFKRWGYRIGNSFSTMQMIQLPPNYQIELIVFWFLDKGGFQMYKMSSIS